MRRRRATSKRNWGVPGSCNLNTRCERKVTAGRRGWVLLLPLAELREADRERSRVGMERQDGRGRADHPEDPHHRREWRGQTQVRRVCGRGEGGGALSAWVAAVCCAAAGTVNGGGRAGLPGLAPAALLPAPPRPPGLRPPLVRLLGHFPSCTLRTKQFRWRHSAGGCGPEPGRGRGLARPVRDQAAWHPVSGELSVNHGGISVGLSLST